MFTGADLGSFRVLDHVGAGGMSNVYAGKHVATGRRVAIKTTEFTEIEESGRRAFTAEIAAMARMHHPSIVRIYDWGVLPDSSGNWCAMEWAPGGALEVGSIGDWPSLRELLLDVLDSLAHAHSRNIIHRDLKPQNILCFEGSGPTYRLADFGLAHSRIAHGHENQSTEIAGTPAYMSPEQLRGRWREFGPWTDLYALGCVAFHLANGRPPFSGASPIAIAMAHVTEPRPSLEPRFDVPVGFADWVVNLMTPDWPARPRNSAAARHALLGLKEPVMASATRSNATIEKAQTLAFEPTLLAETLVEHGCAPASRVAVEDVQPYPAVPIPNDWRGTISPSAEFSDSGSQLVDVRETALVGHDSVRDALWADLRRVVQEESPRVVLIEGEPHSECVRIARWFGRRMREVSALPVLELDASLGRVGREAYLDALKRALSAFDVSPALLDEHLDRFLRSFLGRSDDLIEPARRVFGSEAEPVIRRLESRATFWEFIVALSRRTPFVVWIEGLGREPECWFLIERLLADASIPALVVVTRTDPPAESSAPEEVVRDSPCTQSVVPERLTREQATYVLDSYIRLIPELRSEWGELARRDFPLAIDLVRQAASLGGLVPTEAGYRLPNWMSMPTNREEASELRIHALRDRAPEAARALTVAAQLGRFVQTVDWERAMEALGQPLEAATVDSLMRHDFIRRLRDAFVFPREDERRAFSQSISEDDALLLIETLDDDSARGRITRARLLELTGRPEAAAQELLQVDIYRLNESSSIIDLWYERAISLCGLLPDDHSLMIWAEIVRMRYLVRSPRPEKSRGVDATVERLLPLADADTRAALLVERAIALCYLDRLEESIEICERVVADCSRPDIVAHAHMTAGWAYIYRDGKREAEAHLSRSARICDEIEHVALGAMVNQFRGVLAAEPDEQRRHFDRALELSRKSGDLAQYPRTLLERSMRRMAAGGEKDTQDNLQEAETAWRLGPWAATSMRTAFGINYAMSLACASEHDRARKVLVDTERLLQADDSAGKHRLRAARCVLHAAVGDADAWDQLIVDRFEVEMPLIIHSLSVRFWEEHGDAKRAKEAFERFTTH